MRKLLMRLSVVFLLVLSGIGFFGAPASAHHGGHDNCRDRGIIGVCFFQDGGWSGNQENIYDGGGCRNLNFIPNKTTSLHNNTGEGATVYKGKDCTGASKSVSHNGGCGNFALAAAACPTWIGWNDTIESVRL